MSYYWEFNCFIPDKRSRYLIKCTGKSSRYSNEAADELAGDKKWLRPGILEISENVSLAGSPSASFWSEIRRGRSTDGSDFGNRKWEVGFEGQLLRVIIRNQNFPCKSSRRVPI
jgi:hypothetical protein